MFQPRDVVGRLEAVLEESDRLMREYPDLAAFERAIRAESSAAGPGRPAHAGLRVLRDVISEVVEDARARGSLPADIEPGAAVDAIY
ncbi:TetR/AcrR family transcriptional regulator, partial [Mycobacterium sp. THU-M104]